LDTDKIVESQFGISISEIFSKHGEDQCRDAESAALRGLAVGQQAIIVAGGGAILREENFGILKRLGIVVWLEADEETLFERASRRGNRPLLKTENPKAVFSQMLQARKSIYAKLADIRVDTSALTHEEVADAILIKMEELAQRQ